MPEQVGTGVSEQSLARMRQRNESARQGGLVRFQEGMANQRVAAEGQNRLQLQAMQGMQEQQQTAQLLAARELDRQMEARLQEARLAADATQRGLDRGLTTALDSKRSEDLRQATDRLIGANLDFAEIGMMNSFMGTDAMLELMDRMMTGQEKTAGMEIAAQKTKERYEAEKEILDQYELEAKALFAKDVDWTGPVTMGDSAKEYFDLQGLLQGGLENNFDRFMRGTGITHKELLDRDALENLARQGKLDQATMDKIFTFVKVAKFATQTRVPTTTPSSLMVGGVPREYQGREEEYRGEILRRVKRHEGMAEQVLLAKLAGVENTLHSLGLSPDARLRKLMESPYQSYLGTNLGGVISEADKLGVPFRSRIPKFNAEDCIKKFEEFRNKYKGGGGGGSVTP